MRLALFLTVLGFCLQEVKFDRDAFERRAKEAKSADDVVALEKDLPAALVGPDPVGARDEVLGAWMRLGRPADAVRVVEGLRGRDEGSGLLTDRDAELEATYCRVLEDAGRSDDALAAAERLRVLATSPKYLSLTDDGPSWSEVAHERLAQLHERKGDVEKALAWYRAWRGSSGWPNFRESELRSRDGCVARCLWKLGRVDEALDHAFTAGARPAQFLPDDDPVLWAAEIALRSDRLPALRKRIDAVQDEDARRRLRRSWNVASAFAAKDTDALLRAVAFDAGAPGPARFVMPAEEEFAARLLRELGPTAIERLAAKIREGDATAVGLARAGRFTETLPALRERRKAEGLSDLEAARLDGILRELEATPLRGR